MPPKTIVNKERNPELKHKLWQVNEETETFKVVRVGRDIGNAITTARVNKKLKRDQLAKLMNMPVSVVAEHENGQAIYNPSILIKFERALGIHLKRPTS